MWLRAVVLVSAVLTLAPPARAQIVEPIRPPTVVVVPPLPPIVTAPLPLTPLTPPSLTPPLVIVDPPAPPIAPLPVAPVQVAPPPPPPEAGSDPPDGDSCDCYQDVSEPIYDNGVIVGYRPERRLTGTSAECCPKQ